MALQPGVVIEDWVGLPRERRPHPWRWAAVVGASVLLVAALVSLATNSNIHYAVVADYMFAPPVLAGVVVTLELSVSALALGVGCGFGLALMKQSRYYALSRFAQCYIWFFRSVPQLVQIIWWYNLAVLFPRLVLQVPVAGWNLFDVSTNDVMQKFTAALLALTLCEAAYQAEIIRGALLAPHPTQREAGYAIGMTRAQTMRKILLPQALRAFLPPAGNEFTHLIKGSSVVAFITLGDLMFSVQVVYGQNYEIIPMLIVASLWYMVLVGAASLIQNGLERALRW